MNSNKHLHSFCFQLLFNHFRLFRLKWSCWQIFISQNCLFRYFPHILDHFESFSLLFLSYVPFFPLKYRIKRQHRHCVAIKKKVGVFFSPNILFATAWTHRISVRVRQTKFPKSIMLTAVFLAWVLFPVKCAIFPRSPSFTKSTIVTHTIEKWYARLSEHQTWLGQCCFVFFCYSTHIHTYS